MSEARSRRIESEIQRVLAALIAREVKDPRVGNVTITAVHVAPDMGTARVYFTPFAAREAPETVRLGLTHAASFLRGELGRRLALRHAPRLEFVFDDSVEGAARLTRLIDRAVAADRAAHPDDGGSDGGGDGGSGGDPRR
ncbi:MAG TPA: 30S ribosome-binding factor RbfA [Steroidobacteraceae bacterium]|nr:30S ribosome-binding factor RbfA [Steroidobacteraceae bacterium]